MIVPQVLPAFPYRRYHNVAACGRGLGKVGTSLASSQCLDCGGPKTAPLSE